MVGDDVTLGEVVRRLDRFEGYVKSELVEIRKDMEQREAQREARQARWMVPIVMAMLSPIASIIVQLLVRR